MKLLDKFKSKKARRVLLVGLDGTPYTLVKRSIHEGVMPNLSRLVDQGTLLQMDSSIPEISSVAWSSFMTGCNPASHGVFGFVDLLPNSYKTYFPNSGAIKRETLWEILGRHGKRSVVINVPSTYPARPLNGILIAGFVALDLAKATYPQALTERLEQWGYRIDVNVAQARTSLAAFVSDLFETHQRRVQTIFRLFDTEPWDLFIGAITCTDRLQHFLWIAGEQPDHPFHRAFIDYYKQVDDFLGKMAERVTDDTLFMIMSDHGFTRLEKQVYLNSWLRERGYLKFSASPAKSLEDILPQTKAFALDPGRIYINLKGKFPRGTVEPGAQYRDLCAQLKEEILQIYDGSRRVIKRVFSKEEVYSGHYIDRAPDLLVLSEWGYDLKGAINKDCLVDREHFTGMHTGDDAMLFINSKAVINKRPSVIDVAPTILAATGISPKELMEGSSLLAD